MKKKVRNIVVSEKKYKWAVQENFWPETYLKVWREGNKIKPWLVITLTELLTITPSHVESIINQANQLKNDIRPTETNQPNCIYENDQLTILET